MGLDPIAVDKAVPYRNELLLSRNIKSSRYETVVVNLRMYGWRSVKTQKLTIANMVCMNCLQMRREEKNC